jgi:2-C-methyl-D-erythritol 2,4-cyclodiphosphate synthase
VSVRFEPAARKAIDRAMMEAERHGHPVVGTLHLLYGLLGSSGGSVADALRQLDASVDELRSAASRELRDLREERSGRTAGVAAAADRLLEHAHRLSISRGAEAVSDLDVLIACAQDTDAAVAALLQEAGVTPRQLLAVHESRREGAAPRADGSTRRAQVTAACDATPAPANDASPSAGRRPAAATRSGIGYDSHRFGPGGPLILGGIAIPGDVHLVGHSDGDAIAHAITDAVLGAAGAGDIGEMFSDADPANRGRDSIEMLAAAVARVRALGYVVHQVDVTVIAEQPKIGAHRPAMRRALADALAVAEGSVSVKGKTNEGMGWIGRGEGLACIAVATLVTADDRL